MNWFHHTAPRLETGSTSAPAALPFKLLSNFVQLFTLKNSSRDGKMSSPMPYEWKKKVCVCNFFHISFSICRKTYGVHREKLIKC